MLARGFICLLIIMCAACQEVGDTGNIRPSKTTNEVTQTNLNLAIAYMKERRYEEALMRLEKAKKSDSKYSPIYNAYGLLYQQLNKPSLAERHFKKAIRLDANDSSALNNYGRLLCHQNRIDEGVAKFKAAIDNPLYQNAYIASTNAGLCLYQAGRLDEAEQFFRDSLQINPNMSPALVKMSEIEFQQGNYELAKNYLERYQNISDHSSKSLWLGVRIEQQLGNKNAVSSYGLKLKTMFPDTIETKKYHEFIKTF